MSRVRDITKFLEETRKTNTNLKALRPSTTSTIDSAAVLVMKSASSMSVFSTLDSLPVTNLTTGQQAYVTENSRIYVSNGNGWYNVALVNATPSLTLSTSGTIALTAGSDTTITMTATDSDNDNANLVLSLESGGDLFKFAKVSRDSSVVTITPRTADSATTLGSDGSATLTFKASDGVNQATVQNTFTLSFGPTWTGTVPDATALTSPQGSGGRFGYCGSFNSDGTYAAVGSIGTNDTVTIFTRSGSTWSQQQHITGMDTGGPYSIELTSDATRFVVGFPYTTVTNQYDGSAAVYVRSGTSWSKESDIDAAATLPQSAFFGHALSIAKTSGDYVIIGARDDDPASGNASQGAAYIYKRTGSSWAQQQEITSSDGAAADQFGYSVAMNGDGTVVAVGARGDDEGTGNSGSVYIFTRSGSTWSQSQKIPMPSPSSSAYFGESCMITPDGNYLAIGAWQAAGAGNSESYPGSVYVYTNNGSNSFSLQTGSPFSHGGTNSAGDYTGLASINSLSISDSGKFVSAGTGYGGEQKVWLWEYGGSSWTERYVFTPSNMNVSGVTTSHKFGQYTAMSGNGSYIGIGAFRYNSDVGAWWVNPAPSE